MSLTIPDYIDREKLLQQLPKFKAFHEWKKNVELDNGFDIENIAVQDVDYFGERIGFLKINVTCKSKKTGIYSPGVILRGPSVAVLIVITCVETGEKYVVMVNEEVIQVATSNFFSIPAGMAGDDGSLCGAAIREVFEETGIKIDSIEKLIDLQKATGMYDKYNGRFKGYTPSAGGCDEYLSLYAMEIEIPQSEIMKIDKSTHGIAEEGEYTSVHIVKFEDVPKITMDMKCICAWCMYNLFVTGPKNIKNDKT